MLWKNVRLKMRNVKSSVSVTFLSRSRPFLSATRVSLSLHALPPAASPACSGRGLRQSLCCIVVCVFAAAQAKELLFPVYTFMLVAFLKTVVDLGGNGETRQWEVGWCDG